MEKVDIVKPLDLFTRREISAIFISLPLNSKESLNQKFGLLTPHLGWYAFTSCGAA